MNKESKKKSKIYIFLCIAIIVILFIYSLINIFKINEVEKLDINDMYSILSTNCTEKYQDVNFEYEEIIQEYIDEIFAERNDTEMLMLHLNLEKLYTEKVDISWEEMKTKINDLKVNGTRLNSYEHKFIYDKDVFICKIGTKDTLFTIYEYKPGIYSFAFDGFVE